MKVTTALIAACIALGTASADTISYTGTLSSPEDDSTQIVVTLANPGDLIIQTWGFGGGTNAANTVIPAGGFDPFVGVFDGTGPSATFIDGSSDILTNYGSYQGCPPAGTVNIDGPVCGDLTMGFSLPAGTYTVLLTDGDYLPAAVFETNGQLGDGFFDLTGGAFQTCDSSDCINDTNAWAMDITTPRSSSSTPEPGALSIFGIGLTLLSTRLRRFSRIPLSQKLNQVTPRRVK